MKMIPIHLLLAIHLIIAGSLMAAPTGQESDTRLPVIRGKVEPIFPMRLSSEGIYEGRATVLVEIDEKGRVSDWLPLTATHDLFVESVGRVIEDWWFEPAREAGEPVPGAMQIEFRFNYDNVMLSTNAFQNTGAFLNSLRGDPPELIYLARLSDIDRLPEPIDLVRPRIYSDIPMEARTGEVVLSFFIDQEGRVRMPALAELEGDRRLALVALEALREWRFRPPMMQGRPVIVRASQRFEFRPDVAEQAG